MEFIWFISAIIDPVTQRGVCNTFPIITSTQKDKIIKNLKVIIKIINKCFVHKVSTVADPGFPRGGGANPKVGASTYYLVKNFLKLHENERIWTRDPPMVKPRISGNKGKAKGRVPCYFSSKSPTKWRHSAPLNYYRKVSRKFVPGTRVVRASAPPRLNVNIRQCNVTRNDRSRRRLHHDSIRSRWQHHTHVIFGDRFYNWKIGQVWVCVCVCVWVKRWRVLWMVSYLELTTKRSLEWIHYWSVSFFCIDESQGHEV